MSLATRCAACGTVFRVQQDQLKASEGWVRCGRCANVFNALEGLFDLERESGPVPLQREAVRAVSPAWTPREGPASTAGIDLDISEQPADDDPRSMPSRSHDDTLADTQGAVAEAVDDAENAAVDDRRDERRDAASDTVAEDLAAESAASSFAFGVSQPDDDDNEAALAMLDSEVSQDALDADARAAMPAPSFMRDNDLAARWQRPVVRRLMIGAAVVLPLVFGLQFALHHRDTIAARWPGSADALHALCTPLGCAVQAPRLLDALAVESSGLTRVEGAALYRLQVALRNRAAWAVATPALELTLTDLRGDVVVRRVLRPADLGGASAPSQLAAGAEWPVLATLDVGERRVSGYTIELFYP